MPTTIQISRFRKRRSERFQRSPLRKIGHGCGFAIALLIAAGVLFTSAAYAALVDDLPSVEDIPALFEPPDGLLLQPTRLYDRTGGHVIAELQNPLSKDRVYLHLDSLSGENLLPSTVISATLAASDPSFWQHPGFTLAGLFNASDRTLAQRLVAGSLLSNQPDGWRIELAERLLAFQLTSLFGRRRSP